MKCKIVGLPEHQQFTSIFQQPEFQDYGIEIVEENQDISLVVVYGDLHLPRTPIPSGPVVLLEKFASSSLGLATRTYINKDVLAIFKNTLDTDNCKTLYGRRHYKIINDIFRLQERTDYRQEISIPIKQVVWNLFYSPYSESFLQAITAAPKTKTLFASFYINHNRIINTHRLAARNSAEMLGGFVQTLLKPDYDKAIQEYSVVLSPWGYGDYCMRDYEAIMAECLIIKPLPYRFQDDSRIYNDIIISCRPDFSDLKERLDQAMVDTRRLEDMRTIKQKLLATTKQQLVSRLSECLLTLD